MKNVSSSIAAKASAPDPDIRAGGAVTAVMVVDKLGVPLMPTRPKRARDFLKSGRADVFGSVSV